ncbi:phosphatidate cytidylyltransferase [Gemmatirosa kalamazoonensis]|uniref:Phosphatidate cytidylyltransferase n=1 Tax=Gemmatirosa kalamazoonensis TaxID=861299 RepID=W0REY6_9BACT|nr:hypothetical protein [Gemmatirosa kalamazoonensis]AHG89351.1 phosphatidate cytidylyltransferase [Gemmatirosa kalamazoonensis]
MIAAPAPWIGVGILVVALVAMLVVLRAVRARWAPHPEVMRKTAHVGLGLATLSFPWLFSDVWPVLLLGAVAVCTLLALRYVPALRTQVGGVVHGVDRASLGDLYFPVAATGLFVLARGDRILYTVPILTLAFADAVAALVGVRYGQHRFEGADGGKSAEGSIAFFLVAFLATHLPLLLFTTVGRAESVFIGLTFGVLVMLLEAVAWRGLDNLFIPFGGFLLLRASIALDAAALARRFAVTVALLVLVLGLRRRRTLTDSAMLAGVLVGYVAWSVGGWRWLVPPSVLLVAYTIAWPRHHQIRERPHDIIALFSVTSCGMLWLLLAVVLRRPDFYFPYTLVFAANLCFIGVTWWRDFRRSASRWRVVLATATVAWAVVLTPYVVVTGPAHSVLFDAVAGYAALVAGAIAFTLAVPDLQGRKNHEYPWARQALLGLGASAFGLVMTELGR